MYFVFQEFTMQVQDLFTENIKLTTFSQDTG